MRAPSSRAGASGPPRPSRRRRRRERAGRGLEEAKRDSRRLVVQPEDRRATRVGQREDDSERAISEKAGLVTHEHELGELVDQIARSTSVEVSIFRTRDERRMRQGSEPSSAISRSSPLAVHSSGRSAGPSMKTMSRSVRRAAPTRAPTTAPSLARRPPRSRSTRVARLGRRTAQDRPDGVDSGLGKAMSDDDAQHAGALAVEARGRPAADAPHDLEHPLRRRPWLRAGQHGFDALDQVGAPMCHYQIHPNPLGLECPSCLSIRKTYTTVKRIPQ